MTDHQPAPAPAGRGRGGGPRAATALAGMALFVALLAVGVSLVALSRTGDDGGRNAAATAAPAVTEAPTATVDPADAAAPTTDPGDTGGTDVVEPSPEPTSEPTDGPDPSGVYTVAYEEEPLRLQPSSRYVDLDQPSGNANSSASEFRYSGYAPSFKFDFANVGLASVSTVAATAKDCVQQLRRAPIDPIFAAAKGQLVCVLTNRVSADNQGIKQKIVLMKVASVGADGTLNLLLTAWNVPS